MKTQLISHDQLVEMKGVTKNQIEVFKQYATGKNLFLYGPAGTGKTFVILYNAIKEVLDPKTNYNCIYIVRSLMPTRSIAFMPGDEQDKSSLYQVPYDNMLRLMFKLSSEEQFEMMYEELKKQEEELRNSLTKMGFVYRASLERENWNSIQFQRFGKES